MAGEGYAVGLQLGSAVGNALKNGVAQWRSIQSERQERRAFEGALAVDEQRRLRVIAETTPSTRPALEQVKSMLRKYPDAQRIERPMPGSVRPDGSSETEEVVVTPEGDIPVAALRQFDANEREAFFRRQAAELDRIMNFQSRLPENRFAKQYVAGQFSNLNREQNLFLQKFKAQQQEVDLLQAQTEIENVQLTRRRLEGEEQRSRRVKTFETDEAIRLEKEKARLKGPDGPDLFQRQILRDTFKEAGKEIEGAQSGVDMLSQIDATLERAEKVLASGGARTGAIAGSTLGAAQQRLTNEENVNTLEQTFGNPVLQGVQNMRGLGQLSDRDAQALGRTTGGLNKDEKFNLSDIRRRRAVLQQVITRKSQERDLAVQNREAVIRESGYQGVLQTKGRESLPTGAQAPGAGASEVPQEGVGAAAVPPPVAPELFEDAAAIRRAYRERRITRDEAVRRIAEME